MRSRLDPGIYIPTPRWRAELHDVLKRVQAVRAERRRRVERACEIMTQPEQRFLAAAMAARRT